MAAVSSPTSALCAMYPLPSMCGAKVREIPPQHQHKDFFESLDLCNDDYPRPFEPGGAAVPASEPFKTPKLTHWIWMGSSFEKPEFKSYVADAVSSVPSHTKVMWTDQKEISPTMKDFCIENGIHVVLIDDVFGEGGIELHCQDLFDQQRFGFPVNYGAASDIFRYNLLYLFGGIYFDTDAYPKALLESPDKAISLIKEMISDGLVHIPENSGNDCLIAPPNHKIFEILLNDTIPAHSNSLRKSDVLTLLASDSKRVKWQLSESLYRTVHITGPVALSATAKKVDNIGIGDPIKVERIIGSASWKAQPLSKLPDEAELTNRIARQLFADLNYDRVIPWDKYCETLPEETDETMSDETDETLPDEKVKVYKIITELQASHPDDIPEITPVQVIHDLVFSTEKSQLEIWGILHDLGIPEIESVDEIITQQQILKRIAIACEQHAVFQKGLPEIKLLNLICRPISKSDKQVLCDNVEKIASAFAREPSEIMQIFNREPTATQALVERIASKILMEEAAIAVRRLLTYQTQTGYYPPYNPRDREAIDNLLWGLRSNGLWNTPEFSSWDGDQLRAIFEDIETAQRFKFKPLEVTFDAGYGNQLELRGSGPGMSWEKGLPMECLDGDRWVSSLFNFSKPYEWKIVRKFPDGSIQWEEGENQKYDPKAKAFEHTPWFTSSPS